MRVLNILKGALVLVLLLLAAFAWYRFDLSAFFEPARIEALLEDLGPLAPLIYMAIMAATAVLVPIPGPPLFVIAGALFGSVLGTSYAVAGSVAGAIVAFAVARFLGREFIESLVGRQVVICCECSEGLLTKVVFFSRLLPLVSFDVVSYGAGLTRMRLRNFALATLLGSIPMTFVYHSVGSVLRVGTATAVAFGLAIVAVLFALPYLAERYGWKRFRPRLVDRNSEDPCAPGGEGTKGQARGPAPPVRCERKGMP